jgi:hypothetical protein
LRVEASKTTETPFGLLQCFFAHRSALMKNLTVLIRAELEVPDDWELVEHPSGIQVLKIGDEFIDFDLAPLSTR